MNGNEVTSTINSEEFIMTNNNNIYTTYINTNTLPIPISIGGGCSINQYVWK